MAYEQIVAIQQFYVTVEILSTFYLTYTLARTDLLLKKNQKNEQENREKKINLLQMVKLNIGIIGQFIWNGLMTNNMWLSIFRLIFSIMAKKKLCALCVITEFEIGL